MHSYSGPVLAASSRETKRFQISAMRRASSRVSNFAADRLPGSSSKYDAFLKLRGHIIFGKVTNPEARCETFTIISCSGLTFFGVG
jgi:hypothetical protein